MTAVTVCNLLHRLLETQGQSSNEMPGELKLYRTYDVNGHLYLKNSKAIKAMNCSLTVKILVKPDWHLNKIVQIMNGTCWALYKCSGL